MHESGDDRKVAEGYQRPPESLERQLADALRADGFVDASAIRVQIRERGEVTLTGTVPTEDQQRQAERTAASMQGVTKVENRLEVRADSGAAGDGDRAFGRDKESAQRPAKSIASQPKSGQ